MNGQDSLPTSTLASSERKVRILLVEDNTPDILLTEEALRSKELPFELTSYPDGEVARRELRSLKERGFDLIILDLNMPKVDGLEVLQALRLNPVLADVPVMVLTSSIAKHEAQESLRLGATRFVSKPSDLYEFLEVVGSACQELVALCRAKSAQRHQESARAELAADTVTAKPIL